MPVTINGSNTPTAGGVTYGDGTTYATTSAGTAGYLLQSNGASAPSWVAAPTTSPAGSTGQVQYNNAGAFGAAAGFTFDGTSGLVMGVAGTSNGSLTLTNGTNANTVKIKSGTNTASWTLTLPVDDGTAGQALVTDGAGVTSWLRPCARNSLTLTSIAKSTGSSAGSPTA